MPTEALACPTCNANDTSRPDAHGLHTCVYCGVRYRITGGTPRPMVTAAASPKKPGTRAAVIGAAVIVGAAAILVALAVGLVPKSSPRPPDVHGATGPVVAVASAPAPQPLTVTAPNPTATALAPAPVVATPEPPAAAHFELKHRRPSSGSTFYAVGFVTNDSPYVIDKPKITAVLKDAKGAEVGTAFGFAEDVMAAGATAPAEVLVMNPPAFATIEWEIAPRKATYIPTMVEGLRVEPGPVGPGSFGSGFAVQGKVVHGGTVPARFVHVLAVAYDEAGTPLGIDDTYADVEVLQPGASARFDISMLEFGAKPARWDFTVTGSAVD